MELYAIKTNHTINITNVVGDTHCIEATEGENIHKLIIDALSKDKKVTLSFVNVEILTTAFLYAAIGQLYKDYTDEEIKECITVVDISQNNIAMLKRVVDIAKLYNKDPEATQRSIDEILEE